MANRSAAGVTASAEAVPTYEMLDWDDERLARFECFYDRKYDDELFIQREPMPPAVSLPIGSEAWLQYTLDDYEVVGAHIDGFEDFFLPRHPEFREGWERLVKPHVTGRRRAGKDELAPYTLALLHQILEWCKEEFGAAKARKRAKAGAA